MKSLLLLVLCLLGNPASVPWYQEVDCEVIELNHVVTKTSQLDQVIVWVRFRGELRVAHWEYASTIYDLGSRFNSRTNRYEVVLHLGRKILRIRARSFKETWTDFDPETEDRKVHPAVNRKRLW